MITNYFPRGHDQMHGGLSNTKKDKKGEREISQGLEIHEQS